MKRTVILCISGIIAALVAMSCSQKYVSPTGPTTDTLIVHDTVFVDTCGVDTIFVPTDSCGTKEFCGTIEGSTKSLTWLVSKKPATYHLIFLAETEKDQPPQSVSVTINGTTTVWSVADQPRLVLTRELSEGVITITSNTPPARGHGITICLKIKRV